MALISRDPGRCPECGERVLPFAAGCAICGAELDTARYDRGPSLVQRLGSWFGALSLGTTVSFPALLAVLALGYLAMRFL
jgi:uncharacterized protein (DUF983 family)